MDKKLNNIQKAIKIELDLLEKINHPNIVKYYGHFFKSHHLYIILEYCSGGSISKIVKIIQRNEDIIRQYIYQILLGLEYLHANNIIHRDIKCANILIGKNGTCKLTDFGGAKILKEEISIMTSVQGTPNWMAPEIIKGQGGSRYSDIWSIGCTVLEMYQGEPPYSDKKEAFGVFNAICKKKELPHIPEDMSSLLKDFVIKCLQFEPNKRYNVYELKKHPFFNTNINNSNNDNIIENSINESSSRFSINNKNVID